ncbi:MAG: hypothetical protein HPY61_11140 [Methanotrichaceae archaeon]|nr:hypothetical protein [Methanotrichaceae archaeon]
MRKVLLNYLAALNFLMFCLCSCILPVSGSESQSEAEADYLNLSDAVWKQYNEDIAYASAILDQYVNGKISGSEAMMATVSVYTLSSHMYSVINQANPPKKYLNLHYETASAISNLLGYLWNLSKYYETSDKNYTLIASDYFSLSISDLENAKKERSALSRAV